MVKRRQGGGIGRAHLSYWSKNKTLSFKSFWKYSLKHLFRLKGIAIMKVEKNKVVTIQYTLKDEKGSVLDATEKGNPFLYIQGHQNIIPGLESELEGKAKGDVFKVIIPPKEGYGETNPNLIQEIPKDQFPEPSEIQEGMQFQADTPEGPMILTVLEILESTIKVDGNHPLAGKNLHFEVEVIELRDATAEEINHGHVHGQDGEAQHH